MVWNRIAWKLGSAIIALFLVVLLPLGFVLNQVFTEFYRYNLEQNMEKLSGHYADMAQSNGRMMASMIDMMAEMSNVDVLFLDQQGKEIIKSNNFNPPNVQALAEKQLQQVMTGKLVHMELKNNNNEKFLAVARPLHGSSGAVIIFSSIELMSQTIGQIRNLLWIAGTGAIFLAIGITFIVTRKFSNPLLQMENVARRMAEGDLNVQVGVHSSDEVGSLAKTLNELAAELKRFRDSRSEFFANISHELRAPIAYLEGYSQVLTEGLYESDDEKQNYLRIIHQEAGRLKHLVDDLFELAKMEEGKLTFHIEWINLAEAVDSALTKVLPKIENKGLSLNKQISPGLSYVMADGVRIEQIVINLLDNAIRYTHEGTISIHVYSDPSYVIVEIKDTGPGIPEDELPYIFERFYRVEKSRSRELGGTGLGLSIVKKLVELQDGLIEVKSQQGKGTAFSLKFPIREMRDTP